MADTEQGKGFLAKTLDLIERVGNKLPDPALLFVIGIVVIWIFSFLLSGVDFSAVHPSTKQGISVLNLLSGTELVATMTTMVKTFTDFAPLGVVLVAMLGVGVAEHSGYINVGLKWALSFTPKKLLTPMVIVVGILSHSAVDAGYVLVIPIGGVIFYAAGRHPLAGIAAAFAGVSGGFSANFVPSALDPLLQGFTQQASQLLDPNYNVNPLCNYFFTSASSLLVMTVGWLLTDRFIEPRLNAGTKVDADIEDAPEMTDITPQESSSFWTANVVVFIGIVILAVSLILAVGNPASPWTDANGKLNDFHSPIMGSIVPLIFIFFLVPGVIFGYKSGVFKNSKDIIDAMSKTMNTMAYYLVMAFFCALFINAFGRSNLGILLAVSGADFLRDLGLSGQMTIVGIIILTAFVNLLVGSASAKWGLIGPVFVPMLMAVGISPELTQAAYRIGDSSSNIVTPLMPYFPLVVVFCQRYVKKTGIGTLVSIMLPYSIALLIVWSIFLLIYWGLGLPLGFQAPYSYTPAG